MGLWQRQPAVFNLVIIWVIFCSLFRREPHRCFLIPLFLFLPLVNPSTSNSCTKTQLSGRQNKSRGEMKTGREQTQKFVLGSRGVGRRQLRLTAKPLNCVPKETARGIPPAAPLPNTGPFHKFSLFAPLLQKTREKISRVGSPCSSFWAFNSSVKKFLLAGLNVMMTIWQARSDPETPLFIQLTRNRFWMCAVCSLSSLECIIRAAALGARLLFALGYPKPVDFISERSF